MIWHDMYECARVICLMCLFVGVFVKATPVGEPRFLPSCYSVAIAFPQVLTPNGGMFS